MRTYDYWVEVRGKIFNGKITALDFDDFLKKIEEIYGNFSYLHFKIMEG